MIRDLVVIATGLVLGVALAAGVTRTSVSSEPAFVWLVAVACGAPIGGLSAFVVDRTLLSPLPWDAVLRGTPFMLLTTAVGGLAAFYHPLVALLSAPLSLVAGGALVRARWERSANH